MTPLDLFIKWLTEHTKRGETVIVAELEVMRWLHGEMHDHVVAVLHGDSPFFMGRRIVLTPYRGCEIAAEHTYRPVNGPSPDHQPLYTP